MIFLPKQLKVAATWWGHNIRPVISPIAKDSPIHSTKPAINMLVLKKQLDNFPAKHVSLRNNLLKSHHLLNDIEQGNHSKIFSQLLEFLLKKEAESKILEYQNNKKNFEHDFVYITLTGPLPKHFSASKIFQESLELHYLLTQCRYDVSCKSMGIYAYEEKENDHYYNGRIFVGCPLTQYDYKPLYIPEAFLEGPSRRLGL